MIGQLLTKQGHQSVACTGVPIWPKDLPWARDRNSYRRNPCFGVSQEPIWNWLGEQEGLVGFPFILFATKRAGQRPRSAFQTLDRLGNVVVLERPIHSETLASAVNSALRVRRRQYEARSRMVALQSAEERLTQLNATLEARIGERTNELSRANNQLMQEVAERERAQAALVQSQKMEAVGQLTGGIAHDFNNLLTVITGNLELITRLGEDARIARYANFAKQAADRAAKLTHQLLAFSRTQQLSLAPLSLNALVEGMTDLLERTIGPRSRRNCCSTRLAPGSWPISISLNLPSSTLPLTPATRCPKAGT